jgi:phage gpG-like protein
MANSFGVESKGFTLTAKSSAISIFQKATIDPSIALLMKDTIDLASPARRKLFFGRMARVAREIVRANFKAGGRPVRWKPSGKKARKRFVRRDARLKSGLRVGGKTLIIAGELMNSFQTTSSIVEGRVFTTLAKAPALHFGGRVGNRAVLPARPFLIIPQSEVVFLEAVILDEIRVLRGGKRSPLRSLTALPRAGVPSGFNR